MNQQQLNPLYKSIILKDPKFKPYYLDIIEWLNNQNLILLSDEPEIFLSGTGRIIFQFECLTENKIHNQRFDFLFEETEYEFKISNTFDTVDFSNQVIDLLTFPLIVTYSIRIKKPQNT
ncbi:MAG TPA: hypothetical protein PLP33_23700 [Leptospiraceae bacterium]|jgi:hypothetical protein|nr:hypothetical protein [Leptospiraceae bacterium]